MSQPKRLLNLFYSLLATPTPGSYTGSTEVDQVLATLPPLDLVRLLRMIRDWNANARTSPVAQAVLSAILRLRTADDLVSAFEKATIVPDLIDDSVVTEEDGKDKRKKGETTVSLPELMDGLIPYSERHFVRLEKLVQESYMLDYIVGEMDGGVLGTEVLDLS
jgi:U3 small nucleolar RNA-associated protein 13